ncbi:glyoxalase [Sphingomonas sp. TF3]|uniref:VOC family protein n=1 Tax=Sphingomonas sp. TF3 TaxID=2495580 RepID=UPI000F88FDAC|nr:VOC family protein [Sphingomonas sp. TF3]RUN78195.1 glyoxalase [Sphingomonas sp. TF3]
MALIRPFIPARDFEVSKAFYSAIGFTLGYHDESVAIFEYEGAGLLLQNFYVEEFAGNSMHQLFVADLDAWWPRTADLAQRFGVREPTPPKLQPWGIRVGFLVDPAGVLWHVAEDAPH